MAARLAVSATPFLPTIMPVVEARFFSNPGCALAKVRATWVGLTTSTEVISWAPPLATAE
ncbi:hypothetical protein D3C84_1258060 [compost metagenome]